MDWNIKSRPAPFNSLPNSNARFGHKWIETENGELVGSSAFEIPTPALGINGLKPISVDAQNETSVNSNARFGHKWIETGSSSILVKAYFLE